MVMKVMMKRRIIIILFNSIFLHSPHSPYISFVSKPSIYINVINHHTQTMKDHSAQNLRTVDSPCLRLLAKWSLNSSRVKP